MCLTDICGLCSHVLIYTFSELHPTNAMPFGALKVFKINKKVNKINGTFHRITLRHTFPPSLPPSFSRPLTHYICADTLAPARTNKNVKNDNMQTGSLSGGRKEILLQSFHGRVLAIERTRNDKAGSRDNSSVYPGGNGSQKQHTKDRFVSAEGNRASMRVPAFCSTGCRLSTMQACTNWCIIAMQDSAKDADTRRKVEFK